MKFKLFFILFVLFSSINQSFGQEATITFHTTKNVLVKIYKPIDNAYNYHNISDKIDIKPSVDISYRINVTDFDFIRCSYLDGPTCLLILFPNDKLELYYDGSEISFKGNNAEGITYFNRNFIRYGFSSYAAIIRQNFDDNVNGLTTIRENIQNYFVSNIFNNIEN
jgi:hypothetical protein